MQLFDHLNGLTELKTPYDEKNDDFVKSYNPYMINKFISMCELFIPLVDEINKHPNISKKDHYNYFLNILPKRKQYFKYIKKDSDTTGEDLAYVEEYFEINNREAAEYATILGSEKVNQIASKYKDGSGKQIILQ